MEVAPLADICEAAAWRLTTAHQLPAHHVDDLKQQGLMWCLEHADRVSRTKTAGGYYAGRLGAEVQRALWGAARAEADRITGTTYAAPNYTRESLGLILPGVWDRDYLPPRKGEGGPSAKGKDPSRYARWAVMRADVKRATTVVDPYVLGLLLAHFVGGWTWEEVATSKNESKSKVYRQAQAGLDAMLAFLNPGERGPTVGSRKVVSNAAARAASDGDYYGENRV